jgi:hypothetical protein
VRRPAEVPRRPRRSKTMRGEKGVVNGAWEGFGAMLTMKGGGGEGW